MSRRVIQNSVEICLPKTLCTLRWQGNIIFMLVSNIQLGLVFSSDLSIIYFLEI